MTLIVETGIGIITAESYVSVDDTTAYHSSLEVNEAWLNADLALQEAALRRATRYIDGRYRWRFIGYRTNGRLQALEWPRVTIPIYGYGLGDPFSVVTYSYTGLPYDVIASNAIPREIIQATEEAALRELVSPGSLTPDYTPSQRVVSETVGPISVAYAPQSSEASVRPVVTLIDEILAPILRMESQYTGTAARG